MKKNQGFTLIELLIVISILGLLSSVILVSVQDSRRKAYQAREKTEAKQIITALELYSSDHGDKYPCDVNRGLPSGLEQYLSTKPSWPGAPWPGSVYDWDYWVADSNDPDRVSGCAGSLADVGHGTALVYQLSVRFCDPAGGNYVPHESWADLFDCQSSVYWCISGPCRAHGSQSYAYPGCCLGGNCPSDQPTCGF
ncbi:MAG: type II secretion system protein [Candidatus Nealsonbacteria bacterium]|nr:type II secretion system protein [Candidatus Nealsonbacteria bacterium]